jgi:UDP-GlcNAc:undecaprenyl-phosphate GlcNAc-1-phosphate transferase
MHAVAGGAGWKSVVGVAADLLVVMAALVVAGHLRFGGQPPETHLTLIATALPAVAAGKVLIFSLFGLYHGVWRHAGTPEVVRLVGASAAASVATGAGLLVVYGAAQVSAALLVIDWLIATVAVGGLRFGFRALRQYFAAQREGKRRVVVYGSGGDALLAVRHLRRTLDRTVVGLLDDNPDRHGLRTQGLRILGGPDDLEAVADRKALDAVIVPKRATTPATRRLVAERSEEAGLACRQFAAALRPVADGVEGRPTLTGDGVTRAPEVPASAADPQGGQGGS